MVVKLGTCGGAWNWEGCIRKRRKGGQKIMFEGWEVSTRWRGGGGGAPGLGKMPIESQGCSCPMNICNSILSILVSISFFSIMTLLTCKSQRLFLCLWFWGSLDQRQSFPPPTDAPLFNIFRSDWYICAYQMILSLAVFYAFCAMLYNQALCALEGGGRGWYVLETSMSCKRM